MDLVDNIISYETGEMSDINMLKMFAGLIKDGTAWQLQGHYGRTAKGLIDNGLIDNNGEVDWDLFDELTG